MGYVSDDGVIGRSKAFYLDLIDWYRCDQQFNVSSEG